MTERAAEFCREVEAYLCRKNDGHLIRLVGPAFELVRGWEAKGIPLPVVHQGIDRTFERYYRKGPRRRPVHISFCEDDVLDAFEAWRRAVGVGVLPGSDEAPPRAARRSGLATHVERVITRLTARRAGQGAGGSLLDAAVDEAVQALDRLRAGASGARGEARAAILSALDAIEARLLDAADQALSPQDRAAAGAQAEADLAPFRARMPDEAWRDALAAARRRLVQERAGLPVIRYE